jgi:hypothetical protein
LSKVAIALMERFFSLLVVFYFAVVMPLQAAEKRLPLKGEVFLIQERTAFLILPDKPKANQPIPWVWYARPCAGYRLVRRSGCLSDSSRRALP